MKHLILATTMSAFAVTLATAEEQDPFYLNGGAGPAFQDQVSVHYRPPSGGEWKLGTDTGWRADLAFGYRIKSFVSAEIDSGIITTKLQDVAAHDFYQVPVLANLLLTPTLGNFQPYAGAGVGAAYIRAVPTIGSSQVGSDIAFAKQLLIGCHYKVTSHISIGAEYKLLYADRCTFNVDNAAIDVGPSITHSILGSLIVNF